MNRETRYILYIVLMVFLLVGLILITPGCTIYTVERTNDSTKVTVISSRDFEQPELYYKRDGNNAEFNFGAASAHTNDPLQAIGATVIDRILNQYLPPTTEGDN